MFSLFVYFIHVNCPVNIMFLLTYSVADARPFYENISVIKQFYEKFKLPYIVF